MNFKYSSGCISGLAMLLCLALTNCRDPETRAGKTLFVDVTKPSGVDFVNKLTFDNDFNIYTYRNYYNGGGVALGDINNDGLIDIYLTANMAPNRLFLNKGNFHFEDITDKAGVAGTKAWSTGVSMADVNGDGWLDIYLCNSGDVKGDNKQNELFINNGDLTFSESAGQYGIADRGYSTHAAFFDYDRDGDLDLYILNNSYQAIGSFNLRKNERPNRDPLGGHKLLRNDGNHFTDVSEQAGIYGSVIAFGLGITVGDINKDGWPDIYVSNDFFERDYLYINNQNGTFRECLTEQLRSISGASMGSDIADINNDAQPDIFGTEMLPRDNARLKTVTMFENWDRYQYNVKNDYFHQFTRNMLQLNNGDGTFSEVGRLAGVEATDWSWGALMFDMDNDGLKDIFVANGIFQDLTSQDFLQYISNEEIVKSIISGKRVDYKKLVEYMPSTPVPNLAFHNEGNLKFTNRGVEWGLSKPDFSNGAAYGDLDNDGDLDLVVNNVNEPTSVYRNDTNILLPQNHFLKFQLTGIAANTYALGASITVIAGKEQFYLEQMPIRGFESTMDPRPNMGLGQHDTVDVVTVNWPDGTVTTLSKVATNQTLKLNQRDGVTVRDVPPKPVETFLSQSAGIIDFTQQENDFVDFDHDHLIYHMASTEGPRMSKGDINGDGLEDVYIGAPRGQAAGLFVQHADGTFERTNVELMEVDRESEDLGSVFFDADQDGDLDLYVATGGSEFTEPSPALLDKLYVNDGKGNFTRSPQQLPVPSPGSTSCVAAGDIDGDGDQDLFVGERLNSIAYGLPMSGYILINDGHGIFRDATESVAKGLLKVGMITDALFADVDGDHDPDLIVAGEYMPVKIFFNDHGHFTDHTAESGLEKTNGWWNRIKVADLDADGDIDLVVGNHGLNSRFRASKDQPVQMYVSDFDQNGSYEQIICTYVDNNSYPMVLRHDLVAQMPALKKKYLKYESYKNETIEDVFSHEQVQRASKLEVYHLATSVFLNDGKGRFEMRDLPMVSQLSPTYAITVDDINGDGHLDLMLGGNLYGVKPEVGRYDASYGCVLAGDGKGNFTTLSPAVTGFKVDGEMRDIMQLKGRKADSFLVSRNNQSLLSFTRRAPKK
jgi:hypothetical protein